MYEVGLGDTPMRISRKLNGNPYRYGELLAANPHKEIAHVRGVPTFKSLGVGEQLIVPSGFVGLGALVTLPKTYKSKGNQLLPGQYLDRGDALVTSNGGVLYMQPEGNLVLYGPNGKGQHTALWWTAAHNTPATRAMVRADGSLVMLDANNKSIGWDTQPIQRGRAARIVFQDDGNLVWYDANNKAVLDAQTNGWKINPGLAPKSGNVFSDIVHAVENVATAPVKAAVKAATGMDVVSFDVPVLGDVVNIIGAAAMAPVHLVTSIASGERLDHALVDSLKEHLKVIKDVAPYAQAVVSFVPGIGSGVAAAIGAGTALAEGQSITEAVKSGIRGALPGGPIAAAAFDTALKVASGENVAKAALEGARNLLPSDAAKKAFDIGLAVVTGEKIQNILAKSLASFGGDQLKSVLEAGQKALDATPALANAIKSIAPGGATDGFKMAAGLLSHTGLNEKALITIRNQIPADVRQGFDAALKTQENKIAWLKNVTSAPVTAAPVKAPTMPEPPKKAAPAPKAPTMPEPPKKAAPAPAKLPTKAPTMPEPAKKAPAPGAAPGAPGAAPARVAYAPYPSGMRTGTLSGTPPPACKSLGAPITSMPHAMRNAGLASVSGNGGRPRMAHSPDGNDYLFSMENGALVARQCFS